MSSRKREGEPSHEGSPEKAASIQLDPGQVVIIVDGIKFHCWKEKLASYSNYFDRMFNGDFSEKNKKEVTLQGVVNSLGFRTFWFTCNGLPCLSDETIENSLEIAIYFESEFYESACVEFLINKSTKTKKEQFEIGNRHHSEELLNKLFSTINEKHELDEIIPSDLATLSSLAKDVVIAKSFQFLGIRQPPSPPVPEDSDQRFKHNLAQLIEQVEEQNHHGELVADQIALLFSNLHLDTVADMYYFNLPQVIKRDPQYQELMLQLRNAQETTEKTAIEAQIQLIKSKLIYTALEDEANLPTRNKVMNQIENSLPQFLSIIAKDKKNRSIAEKILSGNSTFEVKYREAVERFEDRVEPRRNTMNDPRWIQKIRSKIGEIEPQMEQIRMGRIRLGQIRSRESYERVSNKANFTYLDKIVEILQDMNEGRTDSAIQNRQLVQMENRLAPIGGEHEEQGRRQAQDHE